MRLPYWLIRCDFVELELELFLGGTELLGVDHDTLELGHVADTVAHAGWSDDELERVRGLGVSRLARKRHPHLPVLIRVVETVERRAARLIEIAAIRRGGVM